MKKRKSKMILAALLSVMLLAGAVPVYAADVSGTETAKEKTAVFDGKEITGITSLNNGEWLLPGSTATDSVTIRNDYSEATNWYLSSEVVQSLEASKNTAAGTGYTYVLTYTYYDSDEGKKKTDTLYNSDIEGKDGDSLQEALAALDGTNEEDDENPYWFYLGELAPEQSGKVTLKVTLDGETTANNYQSSQATLALKFATELVSSTEPTTNTVTNTKHKTVYKTVTDTQTVELVQIDENETPLATYTPPKTSDESRLWLFVILLGLSCLGLGVCFAIKLQPKKKERGLEA